MRKACCGSQKLKTSLTHASFFFAVEPHLLLVGYGQGHLLPIVRDLSHSTASGSSPQPALCELFVGVLLGSCWMGPPSACPVAVSSLLGRQGEQDWITSEEEGALRAGSHRQVRSWPKRGLRKLGKPPSACLAAKSLSACQRAKSDLFWAKQPVGRCIGKRLGAEPPTKAVESVRVLRAPN